MRRRNRNKTEEKKCRALFVCKKRTDSYGISFGLLNSAKMLAATLQSLGVDSKVVVTDDANGIDKEVHDWNPTHVIIHALWVPPKKLGELAARYPGMMWNVRIHSKPTFLAMEGVASEWITGYRDLGLDNVTMSANSQEMQECLKLVFRVRSAFLPNTYVRPGCTPAGRDPDRKTLDIGCFGAVRPMKNHYAQAVAAILYADAAGKPLNFHINKGREEQGGDRVIRNLKGLFAANPGHNLVEHEWYSHEDFFCRVLQGMDAGMQVSLTETFNIVAADMVSAGIPTIGSKDIYWMSDKFHADPNSVDDMVRKLQHAIGMGWAGVEWNALLLGKANKEAAEIWVSNLDATLIK